MKAALTPEQKRRLHLVGVAEAWLRLPTKFPREMRAIEAELSPDEEVGKVFDALLGKWTLFRSGLLFVTDRRLVFVQPAWFRRRVTSISFSDIRRATVEKFAGDLNIDIDTRAGRSFYFRRGIQDRVRWGSLIDTLQETLGDRLIREDAG